MRPRPDPASRSERVASIAAATAITVGTALLVLAPVRPRIGGDSAAAPVRHADQVPEHLAYVIPRAPASTVAPVPPPVHPLSRVEPRHIAVTPPAIKPSEVPDTGSGRAPRSVSPLLWPNTSASWWGTVGQAPAGGFLHRPSGPMRFDSALGVVRDSLAARLTASLPLTQTERDAQLRAAALAAFAARGTGGINPRTISGGASIPFGLPFGGPSHEQRERDRTISAQNKEIQARIQRRVDSTVAARRQRHADSLASAGN